MKRSPEPRSIRPSRRRRRAIASILLGTFLLGSSGCASTLEPPSGDPLADLSHGDPRIRVLAAEEAVRELARDDIEENRRAHLLGRLVESLADRDESVRFFSGIALRKATGVDHGFAAHAPESERATAVERWRAWLARATEPPRDGDDELEANDDREEDGSEPASIASPREPNEGTVR